MDQSKHIGNSQKRNNKRKKKDHCQQPHSTTSPWHLRRTTLHGIFSSKPKPIVNDNQTSVKASIVTAPHHLPTKRPPIVPPLQPPFITSLELAQAPTQLIRTKATRTEGHRCDAPPLAKPESCWPLLITTNSSIDRRAPKESSPLENDQASPTDQTSPLLQVTIPSRPPQPGTRSSVSSANASLGGWGDGGGILASLESWPSRKQKEEKRKKETERKYGKEKEQRKEKAHFNFLLYFFLFDLQNRLEKWWTEGDGETPKKLTPTIFRLTEGSTCIIFYPNLSFTSLSERIQFIYQNVKNDSNF